MLERKPDLNKYVWATAPRFVEIHNLVVHIGPQPVGEFYGQHKLSSAWHCTGTAAILHRQEWQILNWSLHAALHRVEDEQKLRIFISILLSVQPASRTCAKCIASDFFPWNICCTFQIAFCILIWTGEKESFPRVGPPGQWNVLTLHRTICNENSHFQTAILCSLHPGSQYECCRNLGLFYYCGRTE